MGIRRRRQRPRYIWMAVTPDEYQFPICICDASRELAKEMGVSTGTIQSREMKYRKGKTKQGRKYLVVKVPV